MALVSIQQAAANKFARWLEQKLTGIKVLSRWPTGGFKVPTNAISVVCAGERQDQSIEHRTLQTTAVAGDATKLDMLIRVDACYQPMQLDVWAKSWSDRDDIVAQLDDIRHYGNADVPNIGITDPTGNSVLLVLEDGWESTNTFADFEFENPELEDTGSALERAQYRALYRGGARFMLTVQRRVAKQKLLKLSLLLRESDEAAERDLITLAGA